MDTEYLKATVGSALSTGIAETVLMRPEDPVDYLAQRLMKWVMDSEAKKAAGEVRHLMRVKQLIVNFAAQTLRVSNSMTSTSIFEP